MKEFRQVMRDETDINNENAVNTDKEVSNNVGELLKKAKLETKEGKKLQQMEEAIERGKEFLKTLNLSDSVNEAKEKVKNLLQIMYKGHNFTKQIENLNKKRSTAEVVSQAFYAVASKSKSYDKLKDKLESELEGI